MSEEENRKNNVFSVESKSGSMLGTFYLRLDPKRRITIPSIFRSRMGEPSFVYVLPSLIGAKCLEIFAPDAFEEKMCILRKKALSDIASATFASLIGRVSETLDVDVQGRIRIGDELMANIGVVDSVRDIVAIGAGHKMQIWLKGNEPSFQNAYTELASMAKMVDF